MENINILGWYGAIVATFSVLWQFIKDRVNGPEFVITLAYIDQESRHLKLMYNEEKDRILAEAPDKDYEKSSLFPFEIPKRDNFHHLINRPMHTTIDDEEGLKIGFQGEEYDKYSLRNFPGHLVIRFIRQNIGDRMGYLIIDSIFFHANDQTLRSWDNKVPVEEWQMQPDSQSVGSFRFKIPSGVDYIETGKLIVNGRYTNHKGKVIKIKFNVQCKRS